MSRLGKRHPQEKMLETRPRTAIGTAGALLLAAAGLWAGGGVDAIHGARLLAADDLLAADEPDAPTVDYNRDIRPILAENCLACHGPDAATREADLRLDVRETAVEFGAITPGDPEASELIERINLPEDDSMAMPPPDGHKRLSDEQKRLLTQWIAEGAEYQSHWSLSPPEPVEPPEVQQADWPRTPIDRFILAALEERGLAPAPEADRRTLARRLSLDLTGLPPTPEAVERFVNDPAPDFYERYVDQLLKSDRWGEHRGRYWLDYARYADTHGIHFDNYREMWSYRDWVIDAFNRNLPFDQFTIEQLAGDLLPDPTLDQLVATGFNRNNITTNEGGIIDEEYKVLYARDRTETVSMVWMGLTAGCAVCHDHKFDPLSMRDVYSLSAFFDNTTQPVRDGNVADTPPIVTVPRRDDRPRWEQLPGEIEAVEKSIQSLRQEARGRFDTADDSIDRAAVWQAIPHQDLQLHAPLGEGAGSAATVIREGRAQWAVAQGDLSWAPGHVAAAALTTAADATLEIEGAGAWEGDSPLSYSAWIRLPGEGLGGAVIARMNEADSHRGWDLWIEQNRVGVHLVHAWPEDAIKVVAKKPLTKETWHHVAVTYDGSRSAAGVTLYIDGQPQSDRDVSADSLSGSILAEVPLKIGQRHRGDAIQGVRVNDLRLYDRALSPDEVARVARATRTAWIASKPAAQREPEESEELFSWWLQENAPEHRQAEARLVDLQAEREAIRDRGTIAHVMNEADGEPHAYILHRGEYDQRGEQVAADVPAALPPMPDEYPKNRLGLAQWLMSPEHPLTARVTVNRFWQEIFGTGLVESSGDFGIMGTLPSHPELLDWLALEFRDSGWDVKQLFRLIVTSSTYRQSAETTPEKLDADPANRLLARGPRFRLDAEVVRDYGLAASDLLSPTIGGPSVRPYQPEGVWEAVAMRESNTRNYQRDSGEALYRRSMYTFWKRSAPPASMDIFDAPSREVCTVQRERTNTPLQALATLNDTQQIEAARHLAAWALGSGSEAAPRCQTMALRLLARPLSDEELAIVLGSLNELLEHYQAHQDEASQLVAVGESAPPGDIEAWELAAYTMVANQLMNLDEVLNK